MRKRDFAGDTFDIVIGRSFAPGILDGNIADVAGGRIGEGHAAVIFNTSGGSGGLQSDASGSCNFIRI